MSSFAGSDDEQHLQTADNSENREQGMTKEAERDSPRQNDVAPLPVSVPPIAIPSSGSAASNSSGSGSSGSSDSQSCAAHCCSPRRDADDNPRPLITICTAQHRMHIECAKAWMSSAGSNNVSCPLCRDNAVFAALVAMREPAVRPQPLEPATFFQRAKRRFSLFWCIFALSYITGIGLMVGGIYLIVAAKPTDVFCYFDGVSDCPLANTTCIGGGGCEYEQAKLQFLYRLEDGTSVRGSMPYRLDTCPDRCCKDSLMHNEKLICLLDAYNKTAVREFYRLSTSPNYIVGAVCILLGILSMAFPVIYYCITDSRHRSRA